MENDLDLRELAEFTLKCLINYHKYRFGENESSDSYLKGLETALTVISNDVFDLEEEDIQNSKTIIRGVISSIERLTIPFGGVSAFRKDGTEISCKDSEIYKAIGGCPSLKFLKEGGLKSLEYVLEELSRVL